MRAGFYPRLAITGIQKNRRLYVPFILTCVGVIAMYYIIAFLASSPITGEMPGGGTIQYTLDMGSGIIAVFSVIFLFYTNSFLIRRRKKEFGLYNILGMGKRNIACILLWETVLTALLSLAAGLAAGIGLSKLAELALFNVMNAEIQFAFSISASAVVRSCIIFGAVFILLLLNALRQIHISNPITLLRSENAGEKPPKANWAVGILGLLLLIAAYYIASELKDPVTAILVFFAAAAMVIVATYMLFISGSVMFCRILQKNKRYYYKPSHFVSVSSMVYRMKRNGAGLASICILVTMVLVMLSASVCLYFGAEDSLMSRYPRELNVDICFHEPEDFSDRNLEELRGGIGSVLASSGIDAENVVDYRFATLTGMLTGDMLEPDAERVLGTVQGSLNQIYIVPVADYNRMMGTDIELAADETLLYSVRNDYEHDTLTIKGGTTFYIKYQLEEFPGNGNAMSNIMPSLFLVVPDMEQTYNELKALTDFNGDRMIALYWNYAFDTGVSETAQIAARQEIMDYLNTVNEDGEAGNFRTYTCSSREMNRGEFYGIFSGILFIAVILSVVFMFATVLIIYYKQVSEGYEDKSRFDIMQKVGMTKKDIRRSIHSQMLTVFLLPLITAVIHLVFAFPMINLILAMFNMTNVQLYVTTTAISAAAFAVCYTLIYKVTSNAYYNIVSGAKDA